jgi:hypothetical protein
MSCVEAPIQLFRKFFIQITTAQGDGMLSDHALLPWPSFKCIQFWIILARQEKSEQRGDYLISLQILYFEETFIVQLPKTI